MPPANSAHIVMSGHLGGGNVFAAGFWVRTQSGDNATQTLTAIRNSLGASGFTGSAAGLLTPSDGYDNIECYQYDGGPAAADYASSGFSSPGTGTASSAKSQALVMTLRTATPGRSGRGRVYLPCTGLAVAAGTGLLDAATVSDVVTDFGAALEGIDPIALVVYSPSAGALRTCTAVTADYRPDRQEGRERRLSTARATHEF